jgi:hypothetical protein
MNPARKQSIDAVGNFVKMKKIKDITIEIMK